VESEARWPDAGAAAWHGSADGLYEGPGGGAADDAAFECIEMGFDPV
jgi:hypothetical protein